MKHAETFVRLILVVLIVSIFVACTEKPGGSVVQNASSGCEGYVTYDNVTKMIDEGRHIIVVEGRVYDVTNWSTWMNYTPGESLLLKDLNDSEKAVLIDEKGALCPNEMEKVSYVSRIGFSPGTKDFASMLVNKTVDAVKEQQKRVANTDVKYHGWMISTNTTLVAVDGVCRKDVDIIVLDYAPDTSELAACSRKAFVGGEGNESIYIIQGESSGEFLDLFIVTLMEEPCCQLINRYG